MLICQGSPEFDRLLSEVELACGHSGVELAREMGRQHPNLRVLLMSGLLSPSRLEQAPASPQARKTPSGPDRHSLGQAQGGCGIYSAGGKTLGRSWDPKQDRSRQDRRESAATEARSACRDPDGQRK